MLSVTENRRVLGPVLWEAAWDRVEKGLQPREILLARAKLRKPFDLPVPAESHLRFCSNPVPIPVPGVLSR